MPVAISKRLSSPWIRGGLALAAGAVVLLFIGLLFPTQAAFFPLVSLWCSCILFYGVLWVLRVADVEFTFFHYAVLVACWAGSVVYFYWALGRREFIYAWDYVNYIDKQFHAEAAFALGPITGFQYIFDSFTDDYTNFITLFTEFPYCLTSKTGDSYAFAQVFCIVPTLMVLLAGLTIKIGKILNVKNKFYYFLIGFSWTLTYPFLRMSAMLAQPDWFGLIFAFSILLLTLDYRFDRLEPLRYIFIFVATASIILTRRWYLYFVVGYYFPYAILLFISSAKLAKQGEKNAAVRRIKNLILFGICAMVGMLILLWPMVRKILAYNYSDRYSYYNVGGLAMEMFYHISRLGLLNFILIFLGVWLCFRKKTFFLPAISICELCISTLLFTHVQNTGSHQMLIYVPAYMILFLVGSASLADAMDRHKAISLAYWAFTLVFAISVRCSPLTVVALPELLIHAYQPSSLAEYMRLDSLTYDRKDKSQLQTMAQWLENHLSEGQIAYMIPNDMLYNAGHVRNCQFPQRPLDGKMPDGFSVPGTHNFPMAFFEAKYVLTAEPFPLSLVPDSDLSHRFNEEFVELRGSTHQLAATFDMGNGYVFTVWERTAAPTQEEVEQYLHVFDAENAQYPEMFRQVAEAWLAAHGL